MGFSQLLVVCVVVAAVAAWGPLSHSTFNCLALYPGADVAQCAQTQSGGTFGVGSDMPDAFAFGEFNLTEPGEQWLCSGLTYVHDPIFGGEMILLAEQEEANDTNGAFDAVAFAQAYTGHIVGDLVGFNSAGGILCTRLAGGCTAASILYMPEWGYMSALDAYFYNKYGMNAQQLPLPDSSNIGAEGIAFIARASQHYSTIDPKFAPVSPAQISACFSYWSGNMKYVYERAAYYSSNAANVAFLGNELAWFLRPGVSWATAEAYLNAQTTCSAMAIDYYMKALLQQRVGAVPAFMQTVTFVAQLYSQNRCTVPL